MSHDAYLDEILYMGLLKKPTQLYYRGLLHCCRRAFRESDSDHDGVGPSEFTCTTHGRIDVALHLADKIIESEGAQRYHIMKCMACSQKNRVDMARMLSTGIRPVCGKCKKPLQGARN